ncbi:16S rRNA (cytosine(967)-C(5))-methyltransferase [Thermosipho atlanticus]|uniref:16S rRNA (Cytosine967-C5)-methyltransferase n=1 Tax=Thermosipho atlanticus DSM 15807 TaxID=1123380 RepID=A0A1M5R483_9BACT|nr:16S rRNA (cytosine(967)-C(5))-methyltransferase [Thermosipho atlanticus]SHH20573.1 16S rRNA (cytosine967-C5)-methyltransferase [Thermosipho atlanticus DSM 15807]
MNDLLIAYRLLRKKFKAGMFSKDFYEAFSYVEEKAFFKDLVYGVLRRQEYLDWVVNKFLRKKDIPPSIRTILRIGAYLILFTNIPNYAVVNETVNLVEKQSFRKLVNAILRNITKIPYLEHPKELYLKYSVPKWLLEYWKKFLPNDYLYSMLEYNLIPIKTSARVNKRKLTREQLNLENIKYTAHSPIGIIFETFNISPWELKEYIKGDITYQSESSQLIPLLIDFNKDEFILDACSAPGGKATEILELSDVKLYVNDIDASRIELVRNQFKRLNLRAEKFTIKDARKLNFDFKFDKILVDAPCSSLGTARRNPEVLRRQSPKNIKFLSSLQKEILTNIWTLLKQKGLLVYSTCTVTYEENTMNVKWLVEEKGGKIIDIRDKLENFKVKYLWDGYGALFYPDENLTPFYVSIILKE